MLGYLITGLGIAIVMEGVAYAAAPSFMKRMAAMIGLSDPAQLRIAGLVAVAVGVFLVAISRNMLG